MDIVLIGSGNAATIIGRRCLEAGHRILQVYSRQKVHANILAYRLGASATDDIATIHKQAELTIIAIRDEAVVSVVRDMGHTNSLLVHTAGALSIKEVSGSATSYGVLYPLQSLRKEIETIPPLTILTDGNDKDVRLQLRNFAATIAATVLEANDDTRLKYHLAATVVNNFTNHLFTLTESFCKEEHISFGILQPLMEETVMRLRNMSPGDTQTGPALRNDRVTLEKHEELLTNYPSLRQLYEIFSEHLTPKAKH